MACNAYAVRRSRLSALSGEACKIAEREEANAVQPHVLADTMVPISMLSETMTRGWIVLQTDVKARRRHRI